MPFIPRSPHFPSLFTYDVLGSGWQECGLNPGPEWSVGIVAHLVWVLGVGHGNLGKCSQWVCWKFGLLEAAKKKNKKQKPQHNFVHSFFRSYMPEGRNGLWQAGGKSGEQV